jgi:uncharacterized damage-inducible protein DinB
MATVKDMPADPLRAHLVRLLDWEEAHVGFDKAILGLPVELRGQRAEGFEHSPWQLLEHMRLAQKDLLDFCLNAEYQHVLAWPDDYWPRGPEPPAPTAWEASVEDFKADLDKVKQLVRNAADLFAIVPTGTGQQTCLRTVLLVVDHNAYHLGQMVAVRRALGCWP